MNSAYAEALVLIGEIKQLLDEDPDRTTLRVYGRALWRAMEAGDWARVRKGVDIIRPLVSATRELDLIG